MLNLDATVQMHGLTLYRDYNDPGLYWYMPDHPQLALDGGVPLFRLLLYRRDITDNPAFTEGGDRGGGFLTMTVDLAVSDTKLEAARGELAGRVSGDVRLAPVPFRSGRVRVTALGATAGNAGLIDSAEEGESAGTGFVERILGAARPSLYGDNRATFSIELDTEGAQLMRASLDEDGASAISVVYELDYVGLLPAREVSIKIEYNQSYQHLRTRAQLNSLWFKADIDRETERLRQEGKIEIEDVEYLELEPAELAKRQTELQALARELAQWTFFKPGLKPGEVLAKDRGTLSVYDPTADAQAHTAGFTTPLDLFVHGTGRTDDGPATVAGASAASGGVRGGGATATAEPGTAEPGTAEPGTGEAAATQPGTEREPTAVERWNQAGRPQAGFLLRELDQEESQRITFDLRQVSAQRRTAAPQGSIRMISGDSDLSELIKSVDLDDPFFQRVAGSVTSGVDLAVAGVRSMVVQLRYGVRPDGTGPKDSFEAVIDEQGQSHDYQFFMDHRRSVELEYRVTVHYLPDFAIGAEASSVSSDWIPTTERSLDIDPEAVGVLRTIRLTAGQVDWQAVQSVQSTLTYRDADNGVDAARTVVLTQADSAARIPLRQADPEARGFTVTTAWFYESASETVEQQVSRGDEVVLNQPPSKAIPVSVDAVDPLARLAKVTIQLAYQPEGGIEQARVLSLTGGESANWTFFRPNASADPRYRYRASLFGNDGTTDQGDWIETTERQLVVGDVFPSLLEIGVEVIGDIEASGFRLGRLVLIYDDVPEGLDGRHEVALRGPVQPFTWRVPSAKSAPGPYSWELTWFRTDGSSEVQSGESSAELLFLFVPNGAPE